jgi:hypothetical protein
MSISRIVNDLTGLTFNQWTMLEFIETKGSPVKAYFKHNVSVVK